MYILIYVDDLILTEDLSSLIFSFVQALSSRFSLKDLGAPNYFLGVEVMLTTTGLHLSQQPNVIDHFDRAKMVGAKEYSTPMLAFCSLSD